MSLPNIPLKYHSLRAYIAAVADVGDQAILTSLNSDINNLQQQIDNLSDDFNDDAALQASISGNTDVSANTAHRNTTSGNPHSVTKTEVGLGNVPNTDFTATIAANTAKVGITPTQADAIIANTAKVGITPTQADAIVANTVHAAVVTGNPHQVTKAEVGLGNVLNVDTTNASNITTGLLPSSVLPSLAITDTYVAVNESEQLALTVQKGDICVRTDLHRSYINKLGNNTAISDWQELETPTDTILSVNGQTGVVILTTTNIAEGTNLYYTEARVIANTDVTLNTTNRHTHANKAVLDGMELSFTSVINNNVTANNDHRATVAGNPHQVTKTEVGLSNVPNTDFTAAVAANTAKVGITVQQAADIVTNNGHRTTTTGNPHNVTATEVGLGNVANTDLTAAVTANTAHANTTTGNPHSVTKTEVGLSDVPNTDFTAAVAANTAKVGITPTQAADIVTNNAKVGITVGQASDILAANTHRAVIAGNPHQVTKAEVGLGNVLNVDTTNASNITSGTLPTTVLPALAIVDIHVVADETEMLALAIQQGDIAVRTDENKTYIALNATNAAMSDWQLLATPIDSIQSVNGQTGTVVLTTTNIAEGTNLYYTEARVTANADVSANTSARHTHANKAILDGTEESFTTAISNAIDANTAKVGISVAQANAIIANTAKVGITGQQSADIVSNNVHRGTTSGNPHSVTKTEVGLSNVPNTDFTSAVAANTAHAAVVTGNPHAVTATEVGLGNVANTDLTTEVNANTAHAAVVTGNPHAVTKTEVGLGNVTNVDFTAAIAANTAKVGITAGQAASIVSNDAHRAIVAGNPHQVTKTEVGLSNVPNIDTTNASNITTGILPSAVLPPIAITDTHVAVSEVTMLALTVQRGDVVVRSDESRSYINRTGANTEMADWEELLAPSDGIVSVNGQTGTVVLTTTNIAEGTNLYYTEARVTANADVTLNTTNRHTHANKAILDGTEESFTTAISNVISAAWTHYNTTSGNPHSVTKAEVGLGNVPNTDFTAAVAANTAKVGITVGQAADIVSNNAHRAITTGNPHSVTAAEVGLGNVANTDLTAAVNANTTHAAITAGNPHAVTKTEVGLSEVPNTDFTAAVAANTAKVGITVQQAADIVTNNAKIGLTVGQINAIDASNTHTQVVAGNPHQVTKTEVGLSNVPNIDTTNASNITTGTLPSAVLPPVAITDIHVVADETAMLALTIQQGDVAIRTDENKSYINLAGANTAMSDWQLLATPIDSILSVNGQTGVVVLTTTNIAEGTNLYYTEARVIANATVTANTTARHTHANAGILDATNESFTTTISNAIDANTAKVGITVQQAADIVTNNAKVGITVGQADAIVANTAHGAVVTGNPHQVTATEVGLGNVANTDLTAAVAANTAHANDTAGNPHIITAGKVGLGDVPNINFTAPIAANTAHAATVTGNPHAVTKAEVGLGNVTNVDFTATIAANTAKVGITAGQAASIVSNDAHRAITAGNPHSVTKAEVGLGNVANVDTTNAANITTGTLPTSVLPNLAITDTHVVANEAAMLALTIQKGDVAVRTDINRSYINLTGANTALSDWQELLAPSDGIVSVNGYTGVIVLTTSDIAEGTNLYYTEARVTANANVTLNTTARHTHANAAILDGMELSFTQEYYNAFEAAWIHRNIVTGNPHAVTKAEVGLADVPNTDFTSAVAANTVHAAVVTGNPHQVTKTEVGLSNVPNTDFTSAVAANTAKVGITVQQAADIVTNNAKVGITAGQAASIVSNDAHRGTTSGNPHSVTKTEVGLGNVPNTDFTAAVAANTAKVGITTGQANAIVANTAHAAVVTGNPHAVTATEVGLGNVPNVDYGADIALNTTHRSTATGNPHMVTKAEVGLGNVANVDTTNASNITTGTLPTSVLPALAIVDIHVVADETAMLALTVQKGDVAVRTDENKSYIALNDTNAAMSDWQLLATPIDSIQSVNGQTGTVVLTTTNIAEGTNLYYTEARVTANASVTANTAARHTHANKVILDAVTASFTTEIANAINANTAKVGITAGQAASIVSNDAHRAIVTGNPHAVTKTEVGLGNVPNTDFTGAIAANTAHAAVSAGNPHSVTAAEVGLGNLQNIDVVPSVTANNVHRTTVTGNPHAVTKAEVGLSNVPNTDFTAAVAANTAKVGITVGQAASIVSNDAHRTTTTGNPHSVTAAEVGLGNVTNVDFTAEIQANTAARHTHANKVLLDATTASFTTEQADFITLANNHRANTDNPHGVTPVQIGAETPAGAQAKADVAEANANDYTDLKVTGLPNPALLDMPLRNSINMDRGVGLFNLTRSEAANYVDRYGNLRSADADQARFDKHGLLLEGESTNDFFPSEDMATAFSTTNCTITSDSKLDLAFEKDVEEVTITTAGQAWEIRKVTDHALTQNEPCTFSIFLAHATTLGMTLKVRDSSGVNSGDFGGTKSITIVNGLIRYDFTVIPALETQGFAEVIIEPTDTSAGASFAIWGGQVEQLYHASSYIETTIESVTRPKDEASIPYFENFPGSLVDKTVAIDVLVHGTTQELSRAFSSGDFTMDIGDGTPNSNNLSITMAAGSKTPVANKIGKVRMVGTYDKETTTLKMYHDGVMVAEDTTADAADSPLSEVENMEFFFSEVYDGTGNSFDTPVILELPLMVADAKIRFDVGNPFMSISNVRVWDECLNQHQVEVL